MVSLFKMLYQRHKIIFCFRVIPESPRWLLAVGKDDKAIAILERAAKWNKLDTSTIAQRIQSISTHKVHR
jgi:hypothetical protein